MILKDHKRPDGRAITEIRPLSAEIDILPRVHGSGMFTRGQTGTQIKDDPIPGVTIETGSVACPLPVSQYVDIWSRNKMVWALVAKYAMEH